MVLEIGQWQYEQEFAGLTNRARGSLSPPSRRARPVAVARARRAFDFVQLVVKQQLLSSSA